jgi:hypothetical protein
VPLALILIGTIEANCGSARLTLGGGMLGGRGCVKLQRSRFGRECIE